MMVRKVLAVLAVLVGGGVLSGVASADSTSVYFDSSDNLLASPDGFTSGNPGFYNTGTGRFSLRSVDGSNLGGSFNVADGYKALVSNTSGSDNLAAGTEAMLSNTTGSDNTATGVNALLSNTSGRWNVADGSDAMLTSQSGSQNTATGKNALYSAATSDNVADGFDALTALTSGSRDVASGSLAAARTTTGNDNVASGYAALYHSASGSNNTAEGYAALYSATGSGNTALGFHAGYSLTNGHDDVDIANIGVAGESGTLRIGTKGTQTKAFLAGAYGVTIPGPAKPVLINAQGQLGTAVASGAAATARAHAAGVRSASRTTRAGRLLARLRRQQREIDQLAAEVRALQARTHR